MKILFKSIIILIIIFLSVSISKGNKQKIDSLRMELLNHSKEDTAKVNLLNDLAYNLINYKGSRDSLAQIIDEAITLSDKIGYHYGKGQSLIKKGLFQNKNGEYEKSILTYSLALDIFKKNKNYSATLSCHLNAGNSYADLAEYEKSIIEYHNGIAVADSLKDKAKKAGFLNNIGTIYYTLANYTEANNYFVKAVQILEELNDQIKLSSAYANVGIIYFIQKDFTNARKYMLKSYKLYEEDENFRGMASQLLNMATVHLEDNKTKEAIIELDKALEFFTSISYVQGIAECYNQLGAAYSILEEPNKALEYYFKSIKIANKIGDLRGLAIIYSQKANLHLKLKEYIKAEKDALKSNEICFDLKLPGTIKSNYLTLSEVYEGLKKYEKSLNYHKKHIELKDSLFNEEKHKQIAELETEYETEKKQKEIELLSKEKVLDKLELDKQQANIDKKNIIVYSLIGGVFLILILAYIIYSRYVEKQKTNVILEKRNEEIAKQNKSIKDSIKYAKRIQTAILPPDNLVSKYIDNSFIFYIPKDIVSGDFYWFKNLNDNEILFAAVDCTGHGVPGAMMSVIGYNHLNQCVNEYHLTKPSEILDKLNSLVTDTLHTHENHDMNDGMDISLCLYNKKNNTLNFSGAHNPLYIVRDKEVKEYKADRFPIGSLHKFKDLRFSSTYIELQKNDSIFIFTDGFADQFGGKEEKRYMKKNFKLLLIEIASKSIADQKEVLNNTFQNWKGNLEQLDDICIIGVKN